MKPDQSTPDIERPPEDPYVAIREGVSVGRSDEGMARIEIPRPNTRRRRFVSFIFRLPDYKILILDETGTEVLSLINGRRSFSDLAGRLARAHSMEDIQARRSMAAFLERLYDDGVIIFVREPVEGGGA